MALSVCDKKALDNHPAMQTADGLRIYVAGPYSATDEAQKQYNVKVARRAGAEIYRRGHTPFIPHTMTHNFELLYPGIPQERYLETDLVWLNLCEAILMLPNWAKSPGAREELVFARTHNKIIFWDVEDVPCLIQYGSDDNGQTPQVKIL